jgi:hypothetical protein
MDKGGLSEIIVLLDNPGLRGDLVDRTIEFCFPFLDWKQNIH